MKALIKNTWVKAAGAASLAMATVMSSQAMADVLIIICDSSGCIGIIIR
ncbi:hypothetical protein PALB_7620 [Pseudoalteromonas luteoviolacea B = ATCC 29581]|nr:hypothetical protein PALB_7620 [Pseudoalteromonas luteoviolacea B = ATCC 29581]